MHDNSGKEIRLLIGGYEINDWDNASTDSQIETPAEDWSLTLFRKEPNALPKSIHGGIAIQLLYGDEIILTSVADKVSESITRNGYSLTISGRDLAGQLIDCSVPIFNGKQLTLEELLSRYILAGDLSSLIHDIKIQNDKWLKNKVSVEPGESIWDAVAKAAQVTGQHVWLDEVGTLNIGDPFAKPYQVKEALRLMWPLDNFNNVLELHYDNDVSGVFTDIHLMGQDADANSIVSKVTSPTQYTHKRLKIITLNDIETKSEADATLEKIKRDNDLEAFNLTALVDGWTIDGKAWKTGWFVDVETNALSNATAKWAVLGRTFNLSRTDGKTTRLTLKRQGDWAQPLIYKEPQPKKKEKNKKKTEETAE
ncbi:phage baseplate assembly protein [Acinetobacter vivianii]